MPLFVVFLSFFLSFDLSLSFWIWILWLNEYHCGLKQSSEILLINIVIFNMKPIYKCFRDANVNKLLDFVKYFEGFVDNVSYYS